MYIHVYDIKSREDTEKVNITEAEVCEKVVFKKDLRLKAPGVQQRT